MITFSVNPSFEEVMEKVKFFVEKYPTSQLGKEWLGEAFEKSLQGGVEEDSNLNNYGYGCEIYYKKNIGKREVSLLTSEEAEQQEKGIMEEVVYYKLDIVDREELKTNIIEFLDVRDYIEKEKMGLDIWLLLKKARSGNKKAVERFKEIVEEFNMQELMRVILENELCIEVLSNIIEGKEKEEEINLREVI